MLWMCAGPFQDPVNLNTYPDYLAKVARPMDLSMVWKKLNGEDGGPYASLESYRTDISLIAENCEAYCRERFPSLPPVRFCWRFCRCSCAVYADHGACCCSADGASNGRRVFGRPR